MVAVEEADNAEWAISIALHPLDVTPLNELEISWDNVSKGGVYLERGNDTFPLPSPKISTLIIHPPAGPSPKLRMLAKGKH